MKVRILLLLGAVSLIPAVVSGQEDSSRTDGLPSRIGGSRCTSALPGHEATIEGTLSIQGAVPGEKQPVFTVLLQSSGAVVARQRLKNGGTFRFTCAPSMGASLVAELDRVQIATVGLGRLDAPPMTNRQDIVAAWSVISNVVKQRNEVISARQAYKRSDEDQKLFDKALDSLQNGKTDNAVKLLRQIVGKDANDFAAWYELGNIHFNGKKYAEAAEAFGRSFQANKEFAAAAVGAGRSYIAEKDLSAAIAVLTTAEASNPDSADIQHYLGEAHLQNKKGSLAIVHMRKAIELSPADKAELYLRIGALYHAAGGKHLAAEEYKLLLALKPEHPDREKLLQYINENTK